MLMFLKEQKPLYEHLFSLLPRPIGNGFLTMSGYFPIKQDDHNPEHLSNLGLAASVKLLNFIVYLCRDLISHD